MINILTNFVVDYSIDNFKELCTQLVKSYNPIVS